MFELGVLFGLLGLVVLAVDRLIRSDRVPIKPEPRNPYQIETPDAAKEFTSVKRVLDWRIGY